MTTLSITKANLELLSKFFTNHTLAPFKSGPRSTSINPVERSRAGSSYESSGASSGANSKLRLGENVQHSRYGTGRVLAHWSDGTVLVRFDDLAKNQLIWPSFLDRANGQRS
ncbi:MAG: hypothetical protein V3V46_07435 [Anaerolineales bacterium]